jgi:hypothetical protein
MKSIYRSLPKEKYAAIVAPTEGFDWQRMDALHQQALLHSWAALTLTWHKDRPSDKIPCTGYFSITRNICIAAPIVSLIFPSGPPSYIELLPLAVDSAPWYLINCLAQANSFDEATLECMRIPLPDNSVLLGLETWINVIDTSAYDFDMFTIKGISGSLAFSEALRDRFMGLECNGLEFRDVGYVVDSSAQAVPPPSRSVAASTVAKPTAKAQVLALSTRQRQTLESAGKRFAARVQLLLEDNDEAVLDALTQEVQRLRPRWQELSYDKQEELLQELSYAFGDLLRRRCAWQWVNLRYPTVNSYYGVASQNKKYAIYLAPFFNREINNANEPPTLKLLFNMIHAGNLPPAQAGELVEFR